DRMSTPTQCCSDNDLGSDEYAYSVCMDRMGMPTRCNMLYDTFWYILNVDERPATRCIGSCIDGYSSTACPSMLNNEHDLRHGMRIKLLKVNEKLNKENEHLRQTYKDLYDSIKTTRVQAKDLNDSLTAQVNSKTVENADIKAQIQEKVFENVALKNELRKLKGNSMNSSKESYGSNDIAHNYYLNETKKKTQDKIRNLKPREMPSSRTHHTPNTCTPKPRINNQTSRNWPASKSSEEMLKDMQKADHSSNPSLFSDSKHFVCSTCQKCVFNANHDACITKFLKDVNYRVKVQSLKTRNNNKYVEPKIHTQKPSRQIVTGDRFSPNKSFAMHAKTNTPRYCLRWIPTGRIFNTVGLRWVPTGKTLTSSTTKVDCEPPNGSNKDITNPYECEQTLNVSACTLNLSAGTPFNPKKERLRVWLLKKLISKNLEHALHEMTPAIINSGLVPNPPPLTPFVPPSRSDWDLLFQPLFDELPNPPPSVDHPAPKVIALITKVVAQEPVESTGSPSSTTVDPDAPSTSNS
nr:hypothetical protein [Tanacetum cinerariifolium]